MEFFSPVVTVDTQVLVKPIFTVMDDNTWLNTVELVAKSVELC